MRRVFTFFLITALAVFVSSLLSTEPAAEEKQRAFVGVGKCKTCHKTEKQGEQYVIWQESAHAGAYATLAGDEAKAVAKELGIENPQQADECLQCHVTAHGVAAEFLGTKYDIADGVGCESCHGAGGDYYKKKVMKAITAGTQDGAALGLIKPDEKVCVTCHNDKSPSFKGFEFEEMCKKIAHPMPDERREAAKAGDAK